MSGNRCELWILDSAKDQDPSLGGVGLRNHGEHRRPALAVFVGPVVTYPLVN